MFRIVFARLLQGVPVLLVVSAAAFGLFQFIGDPVSQMLPPDAAVEDREALRAALGLADPVPEQYLRFLGNALTGDFGMSLRHGAPVADLLWERLPATVELALPALLLALLIGIPLGVFCAARPQSVASKVLLGGSLLGMSLPTFLLGIFLILGFSVALGVLPAFGRGEVTTLGFWSTGLLNADGLRHLALPVMTLGLFQTALVVRLVRGEMLEVLERDFMKFGRARGLSPMRLLLGHGLRNAILPVIAVMGLQFGEIVAFSMVTESVFQWPGLGLFFLQSVQFADVPVLSAYLSFIALLFLLINLAVDLTMAAVDPRLSKPSLT